MNNNFEVMKQRYEQLKRMYFSSQSSAYDDDGQEVPVVYNRLQIVQMFENMGIEIPLSPDAPLKLKGSRN